MRPIVAIEQHARSFATDENFYPFITTDLIIVILAVPAVQYSTCHKSPRATGSGAADTHISPKFNEFAFSKSTIKISNRF